jgi:hypothetical protein
MPKKQERRVPRKEAHTHLPDVTRSGDPAEMAEMLETSFELWQARKLTTAELRQTVDLCQTVLDLREVHRELMRQADLVEAHHRRDRG